MSEIISEIEQYYGEVMEYCQLLVSNSKGNFAGMICQQLEEKGNQIIKKLYEVG